jgi:hypothetical protein
MSDGQGAGGDAGGQGEGAGAGGGSAADLLGGGGEQQQQQGGGEGGAGAGAGEIAGGADPDWYDQLSSELGDGETASMRDWVKASGAKDIAGLAKIARDNQRALRDSGRIKVPGEGATAEEIAAFNKAIGVPDSAEGYTLPTFKDANGNPVEVDTSRLGRIAEIAHKHGIPKAALEATLQELGQDDMQAMAGSEIELSKKADAHVKGWGAEKDAKLANVDDGIGLLGLQKGEVLKLRAALGPERALDVMEQLGSKVREDTLTGGGKQKFLGDPAAAQRELDAMKADATIRDKVFIPGTPEKARWDRLQDIVAAGADRKERENA